MEIKEITAEETWSLRLKVMYPEGHLSDVVLENDSLGTHFGLFQNDKLITVVSLFVKNNQGQFRKFCTENIFQKQGFGKQMMEFLIDFCKEKKLEMLWCNARTSAIGFYEKFGMKTNEFAKNKPGYIRMERDIT